MTNGKEKRDQKNVLIGTLLAAVLIMAIGYAALAQRLTINGTATISSNWNVAITNITEGTPTGSATNKTAATHDGTTATFDVNLVKPGDKMVYEVTVTNSGTLNAKLTGLTVTPNDPGAKGIYYKVTGVEQNVTTLDASQTNTITVEVGWNAADTTMPAQKTQELTVNLTYTQY